MGAHTPQYHHVELSLALITKRLTDEEAELARANVVGILPGRHAFLLEGIAIEENQ